MCLTSKDLVKDLYLSSFYSENDPSIRNIVNELESLYKKDPEKTLELVELILKSIISDFNK